jgi:drug/metabolite transporter (DMT)-like permease
MRITNPAGTLLFFLFLFFFLLSETTSFSYATTVQRKIWLRNPPAWLFRHCFTKGTLDRVAAQPSSSSSSSSVTTTSTTLAHGVSKGGSCDDDESDQGTEDSSSAGQIIFQGRTTLCIVALLYGTLNVSLRRIYQLPEPPTASALSTARGILACVGFLPLFLMSKYQQDDTKGNININNDNQTKTKTTQYSSLIKDTTESNNTTATATILFIWAGLELAFYNFLAQGLLNIGLLSTSSARASFLTQTSVVLTPVLSRLFGQRVPANVWIACGLALMGLSVLSLATITTTATTTTTMESTLLSSIVNFSTGDWLVLGGAASWSMYLYRLSKIAPKFDEIRLQFIKSTWLAILYAIWLVTTVIVTTNESAVQQPSLVTAFIYQHPFRWLLSGGTAAFGILCYSALGPGTVADILQQQGQKAVSSASEANIILSLEPFFTVLSAWVILGEIISIQEAIGGAIILAAAVVATTGR